MAYRARWEILQSMFVAERLSATLSGHLESGWSRTRLDDDDDDGGACNGRVDMRSRCCMFYLNTSAKSEQGFVWRCRPVGRVCSVVVTMPGWPSRFDVSDLIARNASNLQGRSPK